MSRKYLVAAVTLALVAGPAASLASAAQAGPQSTRHYATAKSDHGSCSERLVKHYPSASTIQRELAVLKSSPGC
jgi:hypothetical protein